MKKPIPMASGIIPTAAPANTSRSCTMKLSATKKSVRPNPTDTRTIPVRRALPRLRRGSLTVGLSSVPAPSLFSISPSGTPREIIAMRSSDLIRRLWPSSQIPATIATIPTRHPATGTINGLNTKFIALPPLSARVRPPHLLKVSLVANETLGALYGLTLLARRSHLRASSTRPSGHGLPHPPAPHRQPRAPGRPCPGRLFPPLSRPAQLSWRRAHYDLSLPHCRQRRPGRVQAPPPRPRPPHLPLR